MLWSWLGMKPLSEFPLSLTNGALLSLSHSTFVSIPSSDGMLPETLLLSIRN